MPEQNVGVERLITLLFHDVYQNSPDESGFPGQGADRYKLSLAEFEEQLKAIADSRLDAPVLVTDLAQLGNGLLPYAISADDGGLSYHSAVAPCMAAYGWQGHCFVTTSRIGSPGFLHAHHIRELHAAGHLIGTHSVSHPPRFDACDWERLVGEWAQSKAVLEDITGEPVVVGSVPGGYYSRQIALAAHEAGLEYLMTSEPQMRIGKVRGCQVLGRFTLRRNSPPGLAGRLVQPNLPVQWQQWMGWNAKKALKKALGNGYEQLTSRLG
jgi:peptidoglycan/xylan/chitin deacetylase (PgdA/CDA1 family)